MLLMLIICGLEKPFIAAIVFPTLILLTYFSFNEFIVLWLFIWLVFVQNVSLFKGSALAYIELLAKHPPGPLHIQNIFFFKFGK